MNEARNRIHLKKVAIRLIVIHYYDCSLYRTLGITLHIVCADYVCGDFFYSTKY